MAYAAFPQLYHYRLSCKDIRHFYQLKQEHDLEINFSQMHMLLSLSEWQDSNYRRINYSNLHVILVCMRLTPKWNYISFLLPPKQKINPNLCKLLRENTNLRLNKSGSSVNFLHSHEFPLGVHLTCYLWGLLSPHWLPLFLCEKLLTFPIYATHSLKSNELACWADSKSALQVPFLFPLIHPLLKGVSVPFLTVGRIGTSFFTGMKPTNLKDEEEYWKHFFKIKQSRPTLILSNIRSLTEMFTLGNKSSQECFAINRNRSISRGSMCMMNQYLGFQYEFCFLPFWKGQMQSSPYRVAW